MAITVLKTRKNSLSIALLALLGLLISLTALANIKHLELGAANYGPDQGVSPNRYKVLDETLADLINEYGTQGTIYLNDIDSVGLDMAAGHVEEWLRARGLTHIEVKLLPGDYTRIKLPQVKSLHLSNPGNDQIPTPEKSEQRNQELVEAFERIAAHSETGMRISSFYYWPHHNYISVLMSLVKDSVFIATGEKGYMYYTPDGTDRILGGNTPPESKTFILISKKDFCPTIAPRLLTEF